MQGSLGIGADLNKWTDTDFTEATRMVAAYKQVRQTVQQGDLYRLIRPAGSSRSVPRPFMCRRTSARRCCLPSCIPAPNSIRSRASRSPVWIPQKQYRVHAIDAAPGAVGETQSGAYWMGYGVDANYDGRLPGPGIGLRRIVAHKLWTSSRQRGNRASRVVSVWWARWDPRYSQLTASQPAGWGCGDERDRHKNQHSGYRSICTAKPWLVL